MNSLIEAAKNRAVAALEQNDLARYDIERAWLDGFESALNELMRQEGRPHEKLLKQVLEAKSAITNRMIESMQK